MATNQFTVEKLNLLQKIAEAQSIDGEVSKFISTLDLFSEQIISFRTNVKRDSVEQISQKPGQRADANMMSSSEPISLPLHCDGVLMRTVLFSALPVPRMQISGRAEGRRNLLSLDRSEGSLGMLHRTNSFSP